MKITFKIILTAFLCLVSINIINAQDCNCRDMYEAAVEAYEKNYSLFIYKVTDDNRDLYNAHKAVLRNKANKILELKECKTLLDQYLHYFRDGHTYILPPDTKEFYREKIKISEKQFKSDYKKNNYSLNPIFGIWENGSYIVAIIPNPAGSNRARDYVGVVLNSPNAKWEPYDVKFELTFNTGASYDVNFMMGDHSIKETTGKQNDKSQLDLEGLAAWNKVWPEEKLLEPKDEIQSNYNKFHLSYIDEIPYLRLPDFYSVERSYVDSIIKPHHNRIVNSDFMIVDVRGNSGGSDGTYFPVLPYVLGGPVELPMNGFWLSEYNIEMILGALAAQKGLSVEEYAKQEKEEYEGFISNKGTAYFQHEENSWTFNADTLYNGPKKIIILTDRETASSGETFVYRVNQSNKVVVYGQNTAGVVDGFNGLPKDIGCFEVVFPSSYRAQDIKTNPIDPYGIDPDVYVDKKVDVLTYAIEHMRQLIENENSGENY